MKSRIYSNYNISQKWKGILDYKIIAIVFFCTFIIITAIRISNFSKICINILMIVFIPIFCILIFCNTKNESSIDIIRNVFRFYLKSKVYVFDSNDIKKYKNKFGKKIYKKL